MNYRKTKNEDLENKPTRFYSNRQETDVATKLGGRKHKNSGATFWQKGDASTKDFLIECKTKTTDSKSITIQKEWLEKNKAESINENKAYSVLAFNFGPNSKENYYILDEQTFILIKDMLESI